MDSSEEDDDFPSIGSFTPQSKVDSLYQSHTEKGIRKLCCELLDLKDAVENLCGNMRTKYLAFLRISEEAVEMEHELVELRKRISAQGILVQDLMTGVCHQLEEWNQSTTEVQPDPEIGELQDPLPIEIDDHKIVLEKIDVPLAEHKVEEALEALDSEERNSPELKSSGAGDNSSTEGSSYRSAFLKRKAVLEGQLVEGSRLDKSIEALSPSCSVCPKTYPATLSKLFLPYVQLAFVFRLFDAGMARPETVKIDFGAVVAFY
ncbi:hypothetical protein CerSpe_147900 [Prunus speciosa]